MSAVEAQPSKIDLAGEPDFRLGALLIRPSTCQVLSSGAEEGVEPRVMEVLVTLNRAQGQTVTRDQLVEACWEGRIVSDDAVTRAIAKVRQLARAYDPPQFTVEAVPRVGFRLVVLPANDAAPAGDTSTPTPTAPLLVHLRKRMGWIRIGAAALAIALVTSIAAWALLRNDRAFAAGHVIVMPFEAPAADAELARLSRRTGEAVARSLTTGGVPTVLSGAPSLPGASAPSAAEFIVTGSVDSEADKTVIRGAITSRESQIVLWSSVAERPSAEFPGFDEVFGGRVARVLRCALRERTAARAPLGRGVFPLFLSACEAVSGAQTTAVELTGRLVKAAPDVGGAHALRAYALATHAGTLDHLSAEAASLTSEMRTAAMRALALDSTAVYAHAALGARIGTEARFLERERHLLQALAIDPDHVAVRIEYSLFLREVGRVGAARETLLRIDGGAGMLTHSVFLHAMTGDLRSAYEFIDRLDAVKPEWGRGARWMVAAWWEDPRIGLAKLPALADGTARGGGQACFAAHLTALVRAGAHPQIRGVPAACASFINDWRIRMLARQGDIDGAYAVMDKPMPKNRQMHMFLFYPEMKAFRADPRFVALARRLSLISYWRETNQWPDFCAEADLPFDCRQVMK